MKQITVGKIEDKKLVMEVWSDRVDILYNGNIYPLYIFRHYDTYIKEHKLLSFEEVVRGLFDDVLICATLQNILASIKELVGVILLQETNNNQLFYTYVCDCTLKAMLEYIKIKLNEYTTQ